MYRKKPKIGIFGSGGIIGSAFIKTFDQVYDIHKIKSSNLYSEPEVLALILENYDIILNLSGYPVFGRWNNRRKELIYNSRVSTTKTLVTAISLLRVKPALLINASAIGIYGDNEICDEESCNYTDNFLAKLITDWENEVIRICDFNVNYSVLRFGVILSRSGGAYVKLRNIFKLGLGGRINSGEQGFSFILIEDVVRIIDFVIWEKMYGIINAVSPVPVTNRLFTKLFAGKLHRPAFLTIPPFILKLLYGEGSTTLLVGQKVVPKRLLDNGFSFIGNNLTTCLNILEK